MLPEVLVSDELGPSDRDTGAFCSSDSKENHDFIAKNSIIVDGQNEYIRQPSTNSGP